MDNMTISLMIVYTTMKNTMQVLEQKILETLPTWQDKVQYGFKVQAIMQYKKENNCSIQEAKEFVDNYSNNNTVK